MELLNIVRPVVAIDRFVAFAGLALHDNPAWHERLTRGAAEDRRRFVQEVRRHYPFFPAVAAIARRDVAWPGGTIPRRSRVLLDLYGTDHDPRRWADPGTFDPDRFLDDEPDRFDLIPQGGGDVDQHHRCAGEWVTIRMLDIAVEALTCGPRVSFPDQDLSVRRSRIPARPESGVRILVDR